jgi:hypothetical protein
MLAAPNARAGSYTHTQTGGTSPSIVTPAADTTYSAPEDAIAYSSVTPYSPDGDPTYTININPGTITDTFTWTHGSGETDANDPPPTCVIVEQTSWALWFVRDEGGTASGSGTVICGLPGAVITPFTYGGEQVDDPSAGLSAVLYSVKTSPGASFSVSCNPTASFTGTTGTEGSVEGEAKTGSGASAYPVILSLGGTTKDSSGNDNILVGQNCTPNLSIPGLPSTITMGWPTWSVSGDTYTSFDIASDQSTGAAIPYPDTISIFVPPPAVYANPTFFWKDVNIYGFHETVQGSATLYSDPAGGLSQNPNLAPSAQIGTVTASKQVQVWEPEEFTGIPSNTSGTPAANPQFGTPGLVTTGFGNGVIKSETNGGDGFTFGASVVTPTLFTQSGQNFGNWAWLQLKQTNETQGSNGTQDASPMLDSSFPYNTGGSTGNGVPGTPYSAGPSSPSGNPVYNLFLDTPDFPYYNYQTAVVASDVFDLYVMYQPPDTGTGVNWVPLDVYTWAFDCNMTRPNILSDWTPNPPGSLGYGGGQANPSYPSWSTKYAP